MARIILILFPFTLFAQEKIIYLQKGQPAPFSGDLYPIRLSIESAKKYEICVETKKIISDYRDKDLELNTKHWKSLLDLKTKLYETKINIAVKELEKAEELATYKSLLYGAVALIVGFAVGYFAAGL